MRKLLSFLSIGMLFVLSCAKEKSYEHGIDENPNYETSWQFKDTSVTFGGNATSYALDSTGMEMEYEGTTADGLGEIRIKLNSLSGILKQGTYKSEKGEVEFSYSSGGAPRYEADLLDSIGEKLTVTILSIDSMSVIGFFTGTARTPSDTVISITEGKFNYRKVVIPTVDSAQGSLGTDADTCTGAAIAGAYKKGLSLTSANTVAVNVNVTKVGFYTIGTDTLKGIYFNKSGIFTSLGVQTVVLNGIGTPLDSGLTVFKVKYGTSVCGFDITIDTSDIVLDYLPTTANSNWSFDTKDNMGITDTFFVISTGATQVFDGKTFNVYRNDYSSSPSENSLVRKSAGLYYAVDNLDDFFGAGGDKEFLNLKDNVPVGTVWEDNFSVTMGGQPTTVKYSYKISEKAVPATIGSLSFADVIKVEVIASYTTAGVTTSAYTGVNWFARGVGKIYNKTVLPDGSFGEASLRRYTIY